jgi:hypothetical protein
MSKEKTVFREEVDKTKTAKLPLNQKNESSSKKNLPPGWTRTTLTMQEKYLQKLKDLAWWGRASPKDALDEILEKFFATRDVPPIPEKYKVLDNDYED